jgi:hypothetical protein
MRRSSRSGAWALPEFGRTLNLAIDAMGLPPRGGWRAKLKPKCELDRGMVVSVACDASETCLDRKMFLSKPKKKIHY